MRLYFHPLSGCSRRVLAFLGVHAIPFERHHVALDQGAHREPAYLRLNPSGRVPTLEHAPVGTLSESVAILRYLAAEHAPATLGLGHRERAKVDQWSAWGLAHPSPAAGRLNAETGLKRMRGEPVDPASVRAATHALNEELALAAAVLEGRPYLAGDKPTIADYVLAPNLESTQALSGWGPSQPSIQRWMERLQAQAGWPKLMA